MAAERLRCESVLELCGLASAADLPATTLSLGQRRAVELARALVGRPRLLLADEPSSGLDPHESELLVGVINRVRDETGLAVIVIDHDLVTVESVAQRVIAMDAGRVIAEGDFASVLSNAAVKASWLGGLA
jgi:ABC-type branched-subunit amino acid transport system ATPase component